MTGTAGRGVWALADETERWIRRAEAQSAAGGRIPWLTKRQSGGAYRVSRTWSMSPYAPELANVIRGRSSPW